MATRYCPECLYEVDCFVLCSECGSILDVDELELSPDADLLTIFKTIQRMYSQ